MLLCYQSSIKLPLFVYLLLSTMAIEKRQDPMLWFLSSLFSSPSSFFAVLVCPLAQLPPQGSSRNGVLSPYVVLSELCSCKSLLSLATATLLGKCSSFSRSRCPAQVSLLALILATMSNDGTKYSSLISLFVMNESLLAFHAPTHLRD